MLPYLFVNGSCYGEVDGVDYSASIFGCVMVHDMVEEREYYSDALTRDIESLWFIYE